MKSKTETYDINGVQIRQRTLTKPYQNRDLLQYSRENRQKYNLAEIVFWKQVHRGKFHGIDFTRQYVIGNYIADFYVRKLGLLVEIDGGYHAGRKEYDARRDEYMRSLGIEIFRVSDYDVLHHTILVMRELERFIVRRFGEGAACGAANLAIASLYCRSTVALLSEHCRSRPTQPLGSSEASPRQDRS